MKEYRIVINTTIGSTALDWTENGDDVRRIFDNISNFIGRENQPTILNSPNGFSIALNMKYVVSIFLEVRETGD